MILASIALAAVATTGAQDSRDADKTRIVAPSPTEAGGSSATPERKYCIVDTPTGTRVPRKACHTRAEWLDRGFDPLSPEK